MTILPSNYFLPKMKASSTQQETKASLRSVFVLAFVITLFLGACSTRDGFRFNPIHENLKFKDVSSQKQFDAVYRNAHFYRDYRPVMIVDALFKDMGYREKFATALKTSFLFSDEKYNGLLKREQNVFNNSFEFVVFLYNGSVEKSKLGEEDAQWKIFLRDDDGDLTSPLKITRLKDTDREFQFLGQHIYELDRWVDPYLVSFPKLSKRSINLEVGEKPLELIITSIEGTLRLTWTGQQVY